MKYKPQLAKVGKGDSPPEGWIVERKWDGMRALFEIHCDRTEIFSRTGQDLLPQFPELHRLHEKLPPCILDGEIVAFMQGGLPTTPGGGREDLELLQMRLGDKAARRKDDIPVEVCFFDVLEGDGKSNLHESLLWRKFLLSKILSGTPWGMPETLQPGEETPRHWEGTVAKDPHSVYSVGKRNNSWQKYKFVERATLRVTGMTPGLGRREGAFGALLVADAEGVERGQVGSGFSDSAIAEILDWEWDGEALAEGRESHFIEVEYRFISKNGLLVNTAFKGIRSDKESADHLF